MGATRWLAVHELRTRWRSVAALALLVGLAGALVLATAAGARRTDSAYERFVEETATRDAGVQIDDGDVDAILTEIEQLVMVVRSGRYEIIPALPTDDSLHTEVDLSLHVSPDGDWAAEIDRPVVLEGRMPGPRSADEVLLNELAAGQTGLGVGDRLEVATFTPEQLAALHAGGAFTGFAGPVVDLQVVGIGRQATDLQGADISSGGVLLVSPAVHQALDGKVGALSGLLAVDLEAGATVAELRDAVRRIVGPDVSFDVRSAEEDFGASTRESAAVLARALAAFSAVALAAGAVAVGGVISRLTAESHDNVAVLAALGAARRDRRLVSATVPMAGVVSGALLAVLLAAFTSTSFPTSVARRVEPHPGVSLDLLVLGLGVVLLTAAGAAWVHAAVRRLDQTRPAPARRRSWTSTVLPPVAGIGVGHAFDRRADHRTLPVRAALTAAVLGVVGVVGGATVVRSFDALVDDPLRYGWAWSAEPDLYTEDPARLVEEIAATPGVDAVASRHSARLELDGVVVSGFAFEQHHGEVEPPLRKGRLPVASDEIVLGQRTADELGADVGDRVPATTADGASTIDVEVVGIGVLAPVETANPGSGAVVTLDGMEQLRRSDGFRSLLVGYAPDFDATPLETSLAERELADFSVTYARPRVPGGLANLARAMPMVTVLGGFFAVLAVLGMTHALVIGTRRRRRELATLRALGMERRQVRAIVVVSGLTTAVAGLVVGVPLGLVVGRLAWRAIIGGQGVLDAATLPFFALGAVAPGALLVAFVASWRPALASTRHLVPSLRAE